MGRGLAWEREMDADLSALWLGNIFSARNIAEIMTKKWRRKITSNAIIGRAHRIPLPKKPSPIKTQSAKKWAAKEAKKKATSYTRCGNVNCDKIIKQEKSYRQYYCSDKCRSGGFAQSRMGLKLERIKERPCQWTGCKHQALPRHIYCFGDTHNGQPLAC